MKAHIVCSWVLVITILVSCSSAAVPIPAPPSASKAAADLKVTAQRELKIDGARIISLSPDGQWLAVERPKQVCVVAVDTLADKQCAALETGQIDRQSIVWSPDSQRIAFTENLPQMFYESDIWELEIQSGKLNDLTPDALKGNLLKLPAETATLLDTMPAWSPDSQTLIFSRSARKGDTALYQVSANGGTPQKVLDVAGAGMIGVWYGIRWLNNGKIVYTVIYPKLTDPANGVWIADRNGQNAKQLITMTDPQMGLPTLSDVSAKGDRALIWYSGASQFGAKPNVSFFTLLDLTSGQTVPLKQAAGDAIEFISLPNAVFSPDGSKVLYVYRGSDAQVHLVVRDAQSGAENDLFASSALIGLADRGQGLDWANNDTLYAATSPYNGLLLTLSSK